MICSLDKHLVVTLDIHAKKLLDCALRVNQCAPYHNERLNAEQNLHFGLIGERGVACRERIFGHVFENQKKCYASHVQREIGLCEFVWHETLHEEK